MSVELTHFGIKGLHGNRNFSIPIDNNRLILVGENGIGKSTVANFIFYCLTQLWDRMVMYDFAQIDMIINNKEIVLTKKDIMLLSERFSSPERSRSTHREVPIIVRREIRDRILSRDPLQLLEDTHEIRRIANYYNISVNAVFKLVVEAATESRVGNQQLGLLGEKLRQLGSAMTETILYLPTYRRIEKELKFLFPELDIDDAPQRPSMPHRRRMEKPYLELVEFGMRDVELVIRDKMLTLKEELRRDLNDLTGTYLRDVIQGAYTRVDPAALRDFTSENIDDVFNRVGETLLSVTEKESLRRILATSLERETISEKDRVVAHFLIRLIELHKRQQNNEKSVHEFVRVCNVYLRDKELVFDSSKFEVHVNDGAYLSRSVGGDSRDIAMKMLSSGEKQIVSLFSHMYLSGNRGYFVIIDEPELSLSVPWQRRFLPDILESGKCSGLIAVTHSPFIFDNDLDQHAHSLDEYMVIG